MAKIVIVLGDSGSGKTASLRNLPKGSTAVLSATGKEFSFKNKNELKFGEVDYKTLIPAIQKLDSPIIVIDDANYLMAFENMKRVDEVGYAKYTDMAKHFYEIFDVISKKKTDQIFYIMSHSELSASGQRQIKTVGNMLSEKIVLEGLSNIILESSYDELNGYIFTTSRVDAKSAAKSPLGMFDEKTMENDLYQVDKKIREFFDYKAISPAKEAK